jgi:7,8-dihydropterin-6-yl-methyl-4-(beta-D-ribofuranosyl)aminobenzene 5'-phosphate synthase
VRAENKVKLLFRLLISLVVVCLSSETKGQGKIINSDSISFTILYNDVPLNDSFIGDQGFSCLLEFGEHSFLFDGGRIEDYLKRNTERLDIDYSQIEFIFISHLHSDHIGGLPGIIEECGRPVLYLPFTFPKTQTARGRSYVAERLDFITQYAADTIHIKHPVKLRDCFYSTGMMEEQTFEQALIINTTSGLIVITGCSHPGIIGIVKKAKALLQKEVYFIMGGFHLAIMDSKQVKEIACELRNLTQFIAPSHCTGERAQQIFKEIFKDDYLEIKAGLKFKVPRRSG